MLRKITEEKCSANDNKYQNKQNGGKRMKEKKYKFPHFDAALQQRHRGRTASTSRNICDEKVKCVEE